MTSLVAEGVGRHPWASAVEAGRVRVGLIVGAVILLTCGLLLWSSAATNFLDCSMECGESLLAVRDAVLFKELGITFGLLENLGTLADPSIYTHNVNIGGFLLIGAQSLGVPERYFLVVSLLVYALGLIYVYLTILYFLKSRLAAIVALVLFASTYWGLGAFALNPLRIWHLYAFFAVLLHSSQLVENIMSPKTIIGLILGAAAAFGCGYDFWIICGAVAASAVILSLECTLRQKVRAALIVAAAFALPFILRQIHVAYVLGLDYWAKDFIYSVAIKVPYADSLIQIPPLTEIDAYYKAHHIMRPPAQPGNTAWQIFFTFRHMVEHITVPRWGYITLGLTALCFVLALSPLYRKSTLVSASYRMILPMLLGSTLGLIAFSPFALHVYFKHEFPLLVFPLIAAKSLVAFLLLRVIIDHRRSVVSALAAVCLLAISIDAALVHWNNTYHSEYPVFGWAKFYKEHPKEDVAMSAYVLMLYAEPYTGVPFAGDTHFPPEKVSAGEEPSQLYWIYQPIDHLTDFDRTEPRCNWTGWYRQLRGKHFPHKPGISCVYDQVFIPTAKPAPPTIDEIASSVKTYDVIERSDLGMGYLVMKKKNHMERTQQ